MNTIPGAAGEDWNFLEQMINSSPRIPTLHNMPTDQLGQLLSVLREWRSSESLADSTHKSVRELLQDTRFQGSGEVMANIIREVSLVLAMRNRLAAHAAETKQRVSKSAV